MKAENLNFLDNFSNDADIKTIHMVKDGVEVDLSIEEIFDNKKYNHFIGVTYSISPNFVNEYLKDFETALIVIGIDNDLVKDSMNNLAKNLKEHISIQLKGDSVKFYQGLDMKSKFNLYKGNFDVLVSTTYIIHSKFYLMWNDEGDNRLVLGSANLSNVAFDKDSFQFENIAIFDNSKVFNVYKDYYEENLSKVLSEYIPKELKKINAKNFKEIKNVDEINLDEVIIISNEDLSLIKEKATVEAIDNVRDSYKLGISKNEIIAQIDNISNDRSVIKKEQREMETAENVAYEIVHEAINKRLKEPKLKSKQVISKQVKEKVEKIVVKKTVEDSGVSRRELYNMRDLRNTKNGKTGLFVKSDLDNEEGSNGNKLIPFGKKVSKEDLTHALKVLNNYMQGFEKFSNNYNDDYGKRVFESLLTVFTSPFVFELRSKLQIEENRLDIPQFVFIGGEAGSGKSSLLSIMSKLTGVNRGEFYQWEDLLGSSLNKQKRERLDRIGNWIEENNVNPILIDEIDNGFFTNDAYARDFIVTTSNRCIRRDDPYPIFIGTTNVKAFALPKEARRRSYYLIIDREIVKTSESKEFFKNIYKSVDDTLFLDFCYRMAERFESSEEYKWDNYTGDSGFDFLYNTREIFKEMYLDAEFPLPRYFPERKYNDDAESNKDKWRKLYLGSKSDFVYDETTGHLFFTITKVNENFRTYGTSTGQIYADALPQEVCVGSIHGSINIELYADKFFEWIEVENPYKKKGFLQKFFGN